MPPKVNLVAGFNRTHLALTSKHLAVEEAVKFARAKSVQNRRGVHSWLHPIHRRQALFESSAESRRLRELSSKLSKLDELLHKVMHFCSVYWSKIFDYFINCILKLVHVHFVHQFRTLIWNDITMFWNENLF